MAPTQTSPTRLLRVVEELKKIDREMPLQTLEGLLIVSQNPGITQDKLGEKLNLSSAAIARFAARCSERERFDKPGLGLIENTPDDHDRRVRTLWLTTKGQKLMNALRSALD